MSDQSSLSDRLERLADETIQLEASLGEQSTEFARKLDVLEQVVELLRLREGALENRLPMRELLASDLDVSRGASGALRLRISRRRGGENHAWWPSSRGRTPDQLQVPLILYLLVNYCGPRQINDLIVDFLDEIRPWLTPLDTETTRTGVMRVMTDTRLAARTLRQFGWLTAGNTGLSLDHFPE